MSLCHQSLPPTPRGIRIFFVTLVLPFSECPINGILQHVGLCCIFFYSVRCIQVMWVFALFFSVCMIFSASHLKVLDSPVCDGLVTHDCLCSVLPLLEPPIRQASRPPCSFFISNLSFTPLYLRFYCYDPDTSSDLFTSSQILCAYNDLLKLLPYDGIFIQNLKLKIQTKV